LSITRLFGTNGIRGIPSENFTLKFISEVSLSIGSFFKKGPILVAHDGRVTSPIIYDAVSSSLMASGIDVIEAGMLPTPALQLYVRNSNYNGGVMVTASHNPSIYNGLKVMGKDGVEISRTDEKRIEKIYFDKSWNYSPSNSIGTSVLITDSVNHYVDGIISNVNLDLIRKKNLVAVVDFGNGMQSLAIPILLKQLNCKCLPLNSKIDGNFPGRGPEPTPDSLLELSESVLSNDADFGVAFDGDGDRSIFVDNLGKIYWGDQSGSILSDHILSTNSNSTIVTTVSTSQLIDYVAKKNNGRVIRTRVGSVDVSRSMIKHNAIFGLEENGGCFYSPHIPTRDGGMSTALMAEKLSSDNRTLSEIFADLPSYHQRKTKLSYSQDKIAALLDYLPDNLDYSFDDIDGLKFYFDSSTWALIRPSGTEPIVRIFAESENKSNLNSYWDEVFTAINSFNG
jgi:phosphomannomutase/phosphoglucomutase